MGRLWVIGRVGLSLVVATGMIVLAAPGSANADPEVCGYVRYGTNTTDTTTTVPYLTYCGFPCPGSGMGPDVPHQRIGDVQFAARLCVYGI